MNPGQSYSNPRRLAFGQIFGRLVVLKDVGSTHALCACACGTVREYRRTSLRFGTSTSCGCRSAEMLCAKQTTHGQSTMPVYKVWCSMKARCGNEKSTAYSRYGGRGITVCERWNDFQNFLEDMGERPDGMTLERRDNDQGYCKDNCYWAPRKDQMKNTSASRRWTIHGETFDTLREASEKLGVKMNTIRYWCMGSTRKDGLVFPPRDGCSSVLAYPREP